MQKEKIKDIAKITALFILPLVIFCIIFWKFLTGSAPINLDTFALYGIYKFYFNSILNGVFPLWEPLTFLGRPFYPLASFNFFNPVTYLMLAGSALTHNYLASFVFTILAYLFLGHMGFYLLAKTLVKDKFLAYLGFLMMVFSGVSAIVFSQPNMLLMYTPCVWFFYFLIEFSRQPQKKFFYGMTFCWMTMITSYLPFYFLTIFLCTAVFYIILYWATLAELKNKYFDFVRKNVWTVIFCLFSLAVSLTPGFLYKATHTPQDIVNPARHCSHSFKKECFDQAMAKGGDMTLKETSISGGLSERTSFQGLFSHLDKLTNMTDDLFFLPIMVYLLIIIAGFQRIQRPVVLLAGVFALLTLIALGNTTPVHKIFYNIVPYFRYFRNLFFFMVYLMPILVLVALFQLKALIVNPQKELAKKEKILLMAGITFLHAVFLLFLIKQQYIISISYTTVLLSCLFWVCFFWEYPSFLKNSSIRIILLTLTLAQPIFVLSDYSTHNTYKYEIPNHHSSLKFSYQRPDNYDMVPKSMDFASSFFYHYLDFKDMAGYIGTPDSVNRWAFYLSFKVKPEELSVVYYTINKFYLYDKVQTYKETNEDIDLLKSTFQEFSNAALVSEESSEINNQLAKESAPDKTQTIIENMPMFRVAKFTTNEIKINTNLPDPKFLVYTDSFNKHWNAYVDGKEEKLYRANLAFKGVVVPSGKHEIAMRYEPPGGTWIYVALILYFFVFFAKMTHSFIKNKATNVL